MDTNIFVCSENYKTKKIPTKVTFSWVDKYIGRKIIRKAYDQKFDHNGYYLENEDYYMNDIIVNINPSIDEDEYITEILYYKIKDLTCGHGRPVTDDRSLTKTDIASLSKVLDSVTEDHVAKEYDALCMNFKPEELLPGGFKFRKVIKSGISLTNRDGAIVKLTKLKILKALYISHIFIDVLYSEELIKEASNHFTEEDAPLYHAILSKVDYSNYRNREILLEEAANRNLIRMATKDYSAFLTAIKDNNITLVEKYKEFAKIVIRNIQNETPLMFAIRNENIDIVQLLLTNSAFSTESYINDEKISVSPLLIAVQMRNYEIMKLLVSHRGAEPNHQNFSKDALMNRFDISDVFKYISSQNDYKALSIILPFAGNSKFDPSGLSDLNLQRMKTLSEISDAKIEWPLEYIEQAYHHDNVLCVAMLKQGSTKAVLEYFIEIEDFEMFSECIKYQQDIRPLPAFELAYQREAKWYKKLVEFSDCEFNYKALCQDRDRYLANLIIDDEFEKFKAITNTLGIGIPLESLDAFCNYPQNKPFSPELDQFLKYILEHIEYTEPKDNGVTFNDISFEFYVDTIFDHGSTALCIEYLDKYPVRFKKDDKYFEDLCHRVILQRNDNVFTSIIRKKMSLYSNELEMNQALWRLLDSIIRRYSSCEEDLRDEDIISDDREETISEMNSWLESLQQFASLVSINSFVNVMLSNKYRRYPETKTIYEYAVALGVTGKEFLSLLQK